MKKLVFIMICLSIVLSACGMGNETEEITPDNHQDTISPDLQATTKPESSGPSESVQSAEESKDNSSLPEGQEEITSGLLYETVKSIYNDTIISIGESGLLSIRIFLDKSTPKTDSELFISIINELLDQYDLDKEYENIYFIMLVDNDIVSMINMDEYDNDLGFSSSLIMVSEEYAEYLEPEYEKHFSHIDNYNMISEDFDEKLNEIYEKYVSPPLFELGTLGTFDTFPAAFNYILNSIDDNNIISEFTVDEEGFGYIEINSYTTIFAFSENNSDEITQFQLIGLHVGESNKIDTALYYAAVLATTVEHFNGIDASEIIDLMEEMFNECGASGSASRTHNNFSYELSYDSTAYLRFQVLSQ